MQRGNILLAHGAWVTLFELNCGRRTACENTPGRTRPIAPQGPRVSNWMVEREKSKREGGCGMGTYWDVRREHDHLNACLDRWNLIWARAMASRKGVLRLPRASRSFKVPKLPDGGGRVEGGGEVRNNVLGTEDGEDGAEAGAVVGDKHDQIPKWQE